MRANPERDLLCVPWRGRAVANSPMLWLDESTVNTSSQKNIKKEKWGDEKCNTGWREREREKKEKHQLNKGKK